MIEQFQGKYRFLSNFWPCTVDLVHFPTAEGPDTRIYPTVENAYQAAKSMDAATREFIRLLSPGEAKKYIRGMPIRPDWQSLKLTVMTDLVQQKFSKGEMWSMLLATGEQEIQEGNYWGDRFWGRTLKNGVWVGENMLGKIITKIREEKRRNELK